jgi:hypothetical protein
LPIQTVNLINEISNPNYFANYIDCGIDFRKKSIESIDTGDFMSCVDMLLRLVKGVSQEETAQYVNN